MVDMRQSGDKTMFDLGWLIGIIDGEGSYQLNKQYHHKNKVLYFFPSLEIGNTDENIILKVKQIVNDVFDTNVYIDTRILKSGKISYKASLRGIKRLSKALPILVEHEVAKKRQAEILLEYITNRLTVNKVTPVTDDDIKLVIELRKLTNSKDPISPNIPKRLS